MFFPVDMRMSVAAGRVLPNKAHQRQAMAVEALESSVKILREKGEIDAQVSSADATDLCGSYGLPVDEEWRAQQSM